MSHGHNAQAVRAKDGWHRWDGVCLDGCGVLTDIDKKRAQSKEGAEFLADEHQRRTTCHCYDEVTMEWSPEAPCGQFCRSGVPDDAA